MALSEREELELLELEEREAKTKSQPADTLLNKTADFLRPAGEAISKGFQMGMESPGVKYSPTGMFLRGQQDVQTLADIGGEKLTEKMASSGKPILSNPYVAATAGTVVQNLPAIAQTAVMPTAPKPMFNRTPNVVEKLGARGINRFTGVKPSTIEYMAGKENPATYGTKLARSMQEEGSLGMTAEGTLNKSMQTKHGFGQRISNVLKRIKDSGVDTSLPVDDVLKPVLDEWTNLSDSALTANKNAARPFEQIYGKLAEKSKSAGSRLHLDDLKGAMDEVGKALERAGEGTPLETAYSKLYGSLAKARESLIDKISEQIKDPSLIKELKSSNEGYTRYSRLEPDIRMKAAKSTVADAGFHPINKLADISSPFIGKRLMSAGRGIENVIQKAPKVAPALTGFSNSKREGGVLTTDQARQLIQQAKDEGIKGVEAIKKRARELASQQGLKW